MSQYITAIVAQYPDTLKCKVNVGERHRIRRIDGQIRRGSLWVAPRKAYDYNVIVTGEVAERMCNFLQTNFGDGLEEQPKGRWKWWKMNTGEVARVIQQFGGFDL